MKIQQNYDYHGTLVPFEQGLYASTEMLSDGYMHLYTNILKNEYTTC